MRWAWYVLALLWGAALVFLLDTTLRLARKLRHPFEGHTPNGIEVEFLEGLRKRP